MRIKPFLNMGLSRKELLNVVTDQMWMKIAKRLPKRLVYWSFIDVGISNIKNNEIVPDVRYTEILQRMSK